MSRTLPSLPSGFVKRTGLLDPLIEEANIALQVLSGAVQSSRANPAGPLASDEDSALDESQKSHSAGLMRVNHVGEVCAQALYRGQALVCREPQTVSLFHDAAKEEVDHLAWCGERLAELGSRTSLLNPIWYGASFGLGVLAGRAGVGVNLGFMAETERQVEAHLDGHLKSLSSEDVRSRQIIEQMKQDEVGHRLAAQDHGAVTLPAPVRGAMRLMSKVMTTLAYKI